MDEKNFENCHRKFFMTKISFTLSVLCIRQKKCLSVLDKISVALL